MADKKVTPPLGAYPQPQPPQGPFLPAPPHQAAPQYSGMLQPAMGGGAPYGMAFGGGGGVYPPYDQPPHHQPLPLAQQLPMYGGAAMYAAAASYPGYIGYPVQYYPYYPTAVQPAIQPLRPTIMIPNGFEGGRFEGLGAGLVGGAAPAAAAAAAAAAAVPPHLAINPSQVIWR